MLFLWYPWKFHILNPICFCSGIAQSNQISLAKEQEISSKGAYKCALSREKISVSTLFYFFLSLNLFFIWPKHFLTPWLYGTKVQNKSFLWQKSFSQIILYEALKIREKWYLLSKIWHKTRNKICCGFILQICVSTFKTLIQYKNGLYLCESNPWRFIRRFCHQEYEVTNQFYLKVTVNL